MRSTVIRVSDPGSAWMTQAWTQGYKQRDIAEYLGSNTSAVCRRIADFICHWCGVENLWLIYDERRKRRALEALANYQREGGTIAMPPTRLDGGECVRGMEDYYKARDEYVAALRYEGLTWTAIAARLDASRERLRQRHIRYLRK